ncbi:MAG TPA: septal ring lytic transglycosylase RlpA family protein [Acidimicrobiales bacterium]|nr:septal ring lytic transglycosylase RlpA family protein [Acidimicrobiales bacterium]
MLVLPLLLLVTPGVASSHASRATKSATSARALVRATDAATTSSAPSTPSATALVTPSWVLVAAAAYQALPTPTTTTTTAPHPTTTTVPVRVAPVTTTTVARTTTTTAAPATAASGSGHSETGQASWYQAPAGTCATPNIPFGTVITVTDLATGASVTCTMDDRQSPSTGRVIDLSEATFAQLANPSQGVIEVRLTW